MVNLKIVHEMVKKQYIKAEIRTLNSQTCNMLATSDGTVRYGGSNKGKGIDQAETKRSMWDDEEW